MGEFEYKKLVHKIVDFNSMIHPQMQVIGMEVDKQ